MGHLNALVLSRGYCRNAVTTDQWLEDEHVPTRLSDESREVVLAVPENGRLVPYADIDSYPWDWSCFSVSERSWRTAGYHAPEEFCQQIDELNSGNRRLTYVKVVIVSMRHDTALSLDQPVSDCYDPRLGWGVSASEGV